MPNNYSLSPSLSGRNLTVDAVLKQPSRISTRIAELTNTQLLVDKFLKPFGAPVQGGAILYTEATAAQMYTTRNLEQRAPGSEYAVVNGERPDPKLAHVEDWGGKFFITDENRIRNNISDLDDSVTQLSNTIVRKINQRLVDAIEQVLTGPNVVPGNDWSNVVTVGPPEDLTPNAGRPAADLAAAQLAADVQELGHRYDTLILNPQENYNLSVTYGEGLAAVLESAGITTLFSSPRVAAGTGYVTQYGTAGTIGFEVPLSTEVWREEATRRTWVQCYTVPAIAITNPGAIKKLTGLAG
ncbi:major capsid protein [Nocardia sp. AG03]|uniref:major capsid protein n=1 Tax=Nocardia sp. AG03 TaxID=3025312 RepID=UPI00241825FE|nr:major capsid protein [Nocardia sp. AG03]